MHNNTLLDDEPISAQLAKTQVDSFLQNYFDTQVAQSHSIHPLYGDLWRTIQTLALSGGKRLRPYMLLLTYQAFNKSTGTIANVLPAAAAQELLHIGMLIHDDIIDRDDIRYGIKNVSGQYMDAYQPFVKHDVERQHYANSAAILAGDLLISQAHLLLQQCTLEPQLILNAQSTLVDAIFHVVGGELLDTESVFRPFKTVNALKIGQEKTASYSFVSPLIMGARLAGANNDTIELLSRLGTSLGIAYQLQDDLLGVFGDEATTGKSSSGDIREGKHTYLIEQFHKHASENDQRVFQRTFGRSDANIDDIQQVRQVLDRSGAKLAVEETIEQYAKAASEDLKRLEISPLHQKAFHDLITRATRRKS